MDPDKIKGNFHRPYNANEEKEPTKKVDPEKFKKVMKIDESEEAQKKKKRNLAKAEEEGEEEQVEETPKQASGDFSSFMSEGDEKTSLFDKESGGIRKQSTPDEDPFTAPPSQPISTEGVELDDDDQTPIAPSSGSSSYEQAPSEGRPISPEPTAPSAPYEEMEGEDYPEGSPQFPTNAPSQSPPKQSQQPPTQREHPTQQPTTSSQEDQTPTDEKRRKQSKKAAKKIEEDSSLLASQPTKKELDALKKKSGAKEAYETKIVEKKKKPAAEQKVVDHPDKLLKAEKVPEKEEMLSASHEKKIAEEEQVAPTQKRINEAHSLKQERTEKIHEQEPTQLEKDKEKLAPLQERGEKKEALEKRDEHGKEQEEGKTLSPEENKTAPFQRFTPQEVRKQKLIKEATEKNEADVLIAPASAESEQGEMGDPKKKKGDEGFAEANTETAGIPLPTFATPAIAPTAESPAYTKLSPEMHALFEKIGGVILVQQEQGVTKTTVNVTMPNSVFDGTQVVLSQYSTAPNAYNIQLIGNPKSVEVFTKNMGALKESFVQGNFNFEVNILNPILPSGRKSPHLIKRKSGAGDKGGQGGKKK